MMGFHWWGMNLGKTADHPTPAKDADGSFPREQGERAIRKWPAHKVEN